jgi:predicted ATP-grasp superfamily ATP-dependent carboligase
MQKIEMFIKNVDKPIAFVLNCHGTGLGVIRSLGRRGIPVIGFDQNPMQIGLFSKYCKRIVCPDIQDREEEYVNFLLALGERLNIKGVLIPTADTEVLAISKHRDKLERYYKFPMAKLDVIEKLANKREFYKTLEKLNMPHPKTYFPSDVSEVKEIAREITYPCIAKPSLSHNFSKEFGIKCFKANRSTELIEVYNKAVSAGYEVVIQEVIPGSDANLHLVSAYFNRASEPLGIFTFRRVRQYPHVFGNGALCVSVWLPEIAELCTSFLKEIKYHGIIDAELKRDPRDNTFKFIEINPRTGWQNRLAARCGVDLPYIAYMDAIGGNAEKVISQRVGVKWLYMFDDMRSSFESISKGEISFIEYVNSLRGEKEYAIFAWDDPVPFFVSLFNLGSALLKYSLRHSIGHVKSMVRK